MRTFTPVVLFCAAIFSASTVGAAPTNTLPAPTDDRCVNIFHDESIAAAGQKISGPINAIMLANLLGHWPSYEVRARPILSYTTAMLNACKATIYLGTTEDPEIPDAFLEDFFSSSRSIAWVGFGVDQLDSDQFIKTFGHRVDGTVSIDDPDEADAAFYQYVTYKDSLFRKSVDITNGKPDGAFAAVQFLLAREDGRKHVVADLIHNKTFRSTPYFLRAKTKYVVGDIPFSYMHEADRYFAFADLLFDILGEKPYRSTHFAFARMEDIHANYEIPLLDAAIETLKSEGVPISMAHIPMFMDPLNAFGAGKFQKPQPATDVKSFAKNVAELKTDSSTAIIWHGVTHQFGLTKNPHTGTSGDDYEFWDMVNNKPVAGASVEATLSRLESALPVFQAYKQQPRYWVTPHYQASALDNRVFGEVFPWQVGRVTYYSSSFGATFTIPAASRDASSKMKAVTKSKLQALKKKSWSDLDTRSEQPLTQMFPFEIYRDVYGQRIVPETLNYLSYATSDQTAFVRTSDDMLADARRNKVVRDYWASFFFHPYVFSSKKNGGTGKFQGDTFELRKLVIGLKLLGYRFTSLPNFEQSVGGNQENKRAGLQDPAKK